MADYNPNNVLSVLNYIKDYFGFSALLSPESLAQRMNEYAPNLIEERRVMDVLLRSGVLRSFFESKDRSAGEQKQLIDSALRYLIDVVHFNSDMASYYLNVLCELFNYKTIEGTAQKVDHFDADQNQETVAFKPHSVIRLDLERFRAESSDEDLLAGQQAYVNEDHESALSYFLKAYERGNALAGVLAGGRSMKKEEKSDDYSKAIELFEQGVQAGYGLAAHWLAYMYENGYEVEKDEDKAKVLYSAGEESLIQMANFGLMDAQYVYAIGILNEVYKTNNPGLSVELLERAASAGHVQAALSLGRMYKIGEDVPEDPAKAFKFLKRFEDSQNPYARMLLAGMFYGSTAYIQDPKEALKHYLFAAEAGIVIAMSITGDIYFSQITDIPEAKSVGEKYYLRAAECGDAYACYRLGVIYFYGLDLPKDIDKAYEFTKRAADAGEADAQYMLHKFYFEQESYIDYNLGKHYLEKAAKAGIAYAQSKLAFCYLGEYDTPKDDQKCIYWLRKAAEQGDKYAQFLLGLAYLHEFAEEGVPLSYPDAIEWLNKAAQQDDAAALLRLGCLYREEKGIPKNPALAVQYLKKAVEQDDEEACVILADMYFRGDCVEQDSDMARIYLAKAEHWLQQSSKDISTRARLYFHVGNIYNFLSDDHATQQKAFDNYCIGLQFGWEDAILDVAFMYFLNNFESNVLQWNMYELFEHMMQFESSSSRNAPKMAWIIGRIYDEGLRIRPNPLEAERWYLKASKRGFAHAYVDLGILYVRKLNKPKQAFQMIEEGYEKGAVNGPRFLGLCYRDGIGTVVSRSKAKALFKEGAQKGDQEAAKLLDEMKSDWFR